MSIECSTVLYFPNRKRLDALVKELKILQEQKMPDDDWTSRDIQKRPGIYLDLFGAIVISHRRLEEKP